MKTNKSSSKIDITAKNEHGMTLLSMAAFVGNIEAIAQLKSMGADIEEKDNYGRTPLCLAAIAGKGNAVDKLKSLRAEVNARGDSNETPLHWVVKFRSANMVKKLVELGADIEAKEFKDKTPLHVAVEHNKTDIIKALLELEANIAPCIEDPELDLNPLANAIATIDEPEKYISLIIDKSKGYLWDDQRCWELVEQIIDKIPQDQRVDIITQVMQQLGETSRRDRLINMLPEEEADSVYSQVPLTFLESIREAALSGGHTLKAIEKQESAVEKLENSRKQPGEIKR